MKWRIRLIFLVILLLLNILLSGNITAIGQTNISKNGITILQKVSSNVWDVDQLRDINVHPMDFRLNFDLDGVIESVTLPYVGTYYSTRTDITNIYVVYGDEVEYLVINIAKGRRINLETEEDTITFNLCEIPVSMNRVADQIFNLWTNFNGHGIQLYTSMGKDVGLANMTAVLSYLSRFITSLLDHKKLQNSDIFYKETTYKYDLLEARKVAPFTVEVARLEGWKLLRDINLIYLESYKYKIFKYLDILYDNPDQKSLIIRVSLEENWTQFKDLQVTGHGEFESLPVQYFVCQSETGQGRKWLEGARWKNGDLWYCYVTDLLGQDLELLADRIVEQLGADRVIQERISSLKLYYNFTQQILLSELQPFFSEYVLDLDVISGFQRNFSISFSDNVFGDVVELVYENDTDSFKLTQYSNEISLDYESEELGGLLINKNKQNTIITANSGISQTNLTFQFFWSYKGHHFSIQGINDTILRRIIQRINEKLDE